MHQPLASRAIKWQQPVDVETKLHSYDRYETTITVFLSGIAQRFNRTYHRPYIQGNPPFTSPIWCTVFFDDVSNILRLKLCSNEDI